MSVSTAVVRRNPATEAKVGDLWFLPPDNIGDATRLLICTEAYRLTDEIDAASCWKEITNDPWSPDDSDVAGYKKIVRPHCGKDIELMP